MRTFNLITSWLLWLICAFYALALLFIRVVDNLPRPETSPEKLERYVQTFWFGLMFFTVIGACIYFIRHHFWFKRGRAAGVGFWALTLFFFLSVLFVTVAGFAPYLAGDRSAIQWASCSLGIIFVAIGFPRLPVVRPPLPQPPQIDPTKDAAL